MRRKKRAPSRVCCTGFQYRKCVMSFIYGLTGHFKNIPLLSSRFLSRTLQNRSSLVNHLTYHKQNLAFASAPPMAALTKLFLSIPVCVMEKMSQNTNFLLPEQYLIKGFVIRPNNESNILSRLCFVRARTPKSINPHLNPTVKMLYYARMRQKYSAFKAKTFDLEF